MPNLVDEYKTIFLGKRGKRWNFLKSFSLYLSFLQICFEVWGASKLIVIIAFSNVLNMEYSTVKYSTLDNVTI